MAERLERDAVEADRLKTRSAEDAQRIDPGAGPRINYARSAEIRFEAIAGRLRGEARSLKNRATRQERRGR